MVATTTNEIQCSFRILTYREGKSWLAHSLESDIIAEGDSSLDAITNLFDLMAFQLQAVKDEEGSLDSFFRPAPSEYWALYSRSKVMQVDNPFPDLASSIEARELVLA